MNLSNALQLLALAAIWGSSFLFMRISVATLTPAVLIEARVGLAALSLLLASLWLRKQSSLLRHWQYFLVIGLFNSAVPFLLFAWSAQTLSASMLSILNATAPIWGTLIGIAMRHNTLTLKSAAGLLLGITGVTTLVGLDDISLQQGAPLAIAGALGAALCYSIASTIARLSPAAVSSFDNAHGSMWASTLLILPLLPFSQGSSVPDITVTGAVLMLGVVCTGFAYLIYFQLIEDVGAPSALTVTFLVPVFGILWGHLLLDETIGWHTITGMLLVVTGTALVTGFSFRKLFSRNTQPQH